jgi:hypothetical protein
MKSVKTKLSVSDLGAFQRFLEHYEIIGVFVGIYEVRVNNFQINNLIHYVYDEDNTTSTLTMLALKYGSVEKAFLRARYTEREVEEMYELNTTYKR